MWILFLLSVGLAALFFTFCKLTSHDLLVELQYSSWLGKLVYILIVGVIVIGICFIFSKITTKFVVPIMDNVYLTMIDQGIELEEK